MPQVLTDLKLEEVSLVDKPACSTVDGKGKKTPRAVIALYKRDQEEEDPVEKAITINAEKKRKHDYGPDDKDIWEKDKKKDKAKCNKGEPMTLEELEAQVSKQDEAIESLTKRNAELDAENALVIKLSRKERRLYADMTDELRKQFLKADNNTRDTMMKEAKAKRREKKLTDSMDDACKAEFDAAGPVQKAAMLEELERLLKARKARSSDDEDDEDDDEDEECDDDEDDDHKGKRMKSAKKVEKVEKADYTPAYDNTETHELRLQLSAAEDRINKSELELEAIRKREREAHFEKRAETELPNTPGSPAEKGSMLQKLAESFGEDSQTFKKLLNDLKNADKILGNQFSEIGKAARGDMPALAVFDAKVEEIAKRDKIDKPHAVAKAMEEAPELYLDYERSQRQAVARS